MFKKLNRLSETADVNAVNTANSVYKDKQIDKMESDIELLKKAIISDSNKSADDDIDTEKLNDLIDFDERIKKLKDSDA